VEVVLFPIFTLAGLFFLIRNLLMLFNEERLRSYLETSPKGKMWVTKFGMEKTVRLTKNIFLPLGLVISAIFIGVGAYGLYSMWGV